MEFSYLRQKRNVTAKDGATAVRYKDVGKGCQVEGIKQAGHQVRIRLADCIKIYIKHIRSAKTVPGCRKSLLLHTAIAALR